MMERTSCGPGIKRYVYITVAVTLEALHRKHLKGIANAPIILRWKVGKSHVNVISPAPFTSKPKRSILT